MPHWHPDGAGITNSDTAGTRSPKLGQHNIHTSPGSITSQTKVSSFSAPSLLHPDRLRSAVRRLTFYLPRSFCCWLIILVVLIFSLQLCVSLLHWLNGTPPFVPESDLNSNLRQHAREITHDPVTWIKEHSYTSRHVSERPRAALISLVRNEELEGILQSMSQLEHHWNKHHNYPWIFFNEKPFSGAFKAATSNATAARTEYHLVPQAHWITPSHIDQARYFDSLDYLSLISVGKGHLLSYHAMIRWQSGLFYLHPALASYDYYWRVEPDVHFFCDIPYDPFAFMAANDMVYGFNMAILDDARSFASLWSTTRAFLAENPNLVHPSANLDWLLDPRTGGGYNNCQFFSNFEIGSLKFFREDPGVRQYSDHLEQEGGFYYSRWGDAPVHTLMVSLFAAPERIWWFRDVGYQHDIARHCPPPSNPFQGIRDFENKASAKHEILTQQSAAIVRANQELNRLGWLSGRCSCEPTALDENFYKLVPMESPQVKPADTCIRLWLGAEWLEKEEGWDQDVERTLGGDGYGGYVLDGM
jgi:alpha 1,2-mannosyltransferase